MNKLLNTSYGILAIIGVVGIIAIVSYGIMSCFVVMVCAAYFGFMSLNFWGELIIALIALLILAAIISNRFDKKK